MTTEPREGGPHNAGLAAGAPFVAGAWHLVVDGFSRRLRVVRVAGEQRPWSCSLVLRAVSFSRPPSIPGVFGEPLLPCSTPRDSSQELYNVPFLAVKMVM